MINQPMRKSLFDCLVALLPIASLVAEPLHHSVSWIGNTFSGASNKWVQNYFFSSHGQPDGGVFILLSGRRN